MFWKIENKKNKGGEMMYMSGMDAFMFNVFPVIFMIAFVFILGIMVVGVIQGAREWKHNNDSPRLTVDAKVVAKRSSVHYHNHNNGVNNTHSHSSSTTYFVTFEVQSGDRMELRVPDKEYGMVVEGDRGSLTFQGTRYFSFERVR